MDVNLRSSALHKAMSGELREAEVDIVLPVQGFPWSQLHSYAATHESQKSPSARCSCPAGHEELGCQDSTDTSSLKHSLLTA